MRVVLLQPPFFRCVGSHNDRPPLELCYASGYLTQAGVDHVVLNADFTGSALYIPWSQLFEQFDLFQAAVEGKSPLYSETAERVLDMNPDVVVVSAGDSVIPVLDCGSPWLGVRMAETLQRYGVRTVGVGPFYGEAPEVFGEAFDTIVRGMSGPVILAAVQDAGRKRLLEGKAPVDVKPSFEALLPAGQHLDTMMTSLGCGWACDFCYAPKVLRGVKHFSPEIVAADLEQRGLSELYIRDMVFGLNIRRLKELAPILAGRRYTVETRADTLTPDLLDAMRECGVVRLKMGVEVLDDTALSKMKKGQGTAEIDRGISLAKEGGFKVVLYVLLGGLYADRAAYQRTYDYVERQEPEGIVVSVASYLTFDQHYRYDAHFSPFAAMQWAVGHDILSRFLVLQDRLGKTSMRVQACAPS